MRKTIIVSLATGAIILVEMEHYLHSDCNLINEVRIVTKEKEPLGKHSHGEKIETDFWRDKGGTYGIMPETTRI